MRRPLAIPAFPLGQSLHRGVGRARERGLGLPVHRHGCPVERAADAAAGNTDGCEQVVREGGAAELLQSAQQVGTVGRRIDATALGGDHIDGIAPPLESGAVPARTPPAVERDRDIGDGLSGLRSGGAPGAERGHRAHVVIVVQPEQCADHRRGEQEGK